MHTQNLHFRQNKNVEIWAQLIFLAKQEFQVFLNNDSKVNHLGDEQITKCYVKVDQITLKFIWLANPV